MNVLSLRPASVSWPVERGWFHRREVEQRRDFLELVVDGEPLRRSFADSGALIPALPVGERRDAAFAAQTLGALLGETVESYQDGCVPLIICGIDNDAYCGAVTVQVTLDEAAATWRLGWHTLDGHDGSIHRHQAPESDEPRELVFARDAYEALLRPERGRLIEVADWMPAYPFIPPA